MRLFLNSRVELTSHRRSSVSWDEGAAFSKRFSPYELLRCVPPTSPGLTDYRDALAALQRGVRGGVRRAGARPPSRHDPSRNALNAARQAARLLRAAVVRGARSCDGATIGGWAARLTVTHCLETLESHPSGHRRTFLWRARSEGHCSVESAC